MKLSISSGVSRAESDVIYWNSNLDQKLHGHCCQQETPNYTDICLIDIFKYFLHLPQIST